LDYDIHHAVHDVCLWLPEAQETTSHGSSSFKVRGKTFAYFVVNHHGDGRVALWIAASPGTQEAHVSADPEQFFVPPYVGPRGWLGIHLNKDLAWQRVAALVREAYERVAPAALSRTLGATPAVKTPSGLSAGEMDPLRSARGKALLQTMRRLCLSFPESREALQFGFPVWQAGRKTFALARGGDPGLTVNFWVGVDRQQLLIADARYRIPPYMGHNGWIALDVSGGCDRNEVAALAEQSYRHFALKRMLKSLDSAAR
jgi:predicted DNA-binding protein (MmcQ/YjbR family)